MKKLSKLILLLIVAHLLVACTTNLSTLPPTPTKAAANTPLPTVGGATPPTPSGGQGFTPPLQVTVAPDSSPNPGKVGPTVGANGQITVIAPTANPTAFKGTFFWSKDNNVWQGGTNVPALTSAKLGGQALTKVSPLAIATYPALSPDGNTLAYSFSPEPDISNPNKIIVGQDIVGVDLKTKQTKLLVKRPEPDSFVDNPAWSADGKYLYYSFRSPVRSKENFVVGQKLGIARLDLTTGQTENLIEDATQPHPAPDGKSVVFVGIAASAQTYNYSFQILDLATKKATLLTKPDQKFLSFYFPRISPDSQTIVFAAVGGPDADLTNINPNAPIITPTPSNSVIQLDNWGGGVSEPARFSLVQVDNAKMSSAKASNIAALHGLPYDLWLIKLDGTGLRRLTTLFEDQPMPAWSKDGKQIIFLAGLGLYIINADGTGLVKISDEGGHGGFDYN